MSQNHPTVVFISEDPRVSHRANEAMRIALGIVAGDNPVSIVLSGPAVHLLDDDTDDHIQRDCISVVEAAVEQALASPSPLPPQALDNVLWREG